MIDYIMSYEFVSFLALFTYWIPALICLSVYLFQCIYEYRQDLEKSSKDHYHPTLTVGIIFWRIILSITPAVNLIAMVFDTASSVFKWLGSVLNIPLVRKKY